MASVELDIYSSLKTQGYITPSCSKCRVLSDVFSTGGATDESLELLEPTQFTATRVLAISAANKLLGYSVWLHPDS